MALNVQKSQQKQTNGNFIPESPVKKSAAGILTGFNMTNDNERNSNETALVRFLNVAHRRIAYFIADHAIPTIVTCLLITTICGFQYMRVPFENDLVGYVPYGVRSLVEAEVYKKFYNMHGRGIQINALITAKDNGSLLRPEILKEIWEIHNIITTNFTIRNRITGKDQNYNEFCTSFCRLNDPILHLMNGLDIQLGRLAANLSLNDHIKLNYPRTTMYGDSFNIQLTYNGVILVNDTRVDEKMLREAGDVARATNMAYVKLIFLHYKAQRIGGWTNEDVDNFELSVIKYFQQSYKSENLKINTLGYAYVYKEIVRAGYTLGPYLAVGLLIMLCCALTTTIVCDAYMRQTSYHKIYLAIVACICPLMASTTAMGILFSFGLRNATILCVTPFLVLAIGVDDAYLMMHAWRTVTKNCKERPVKEDSAGYRLAEVMVETGPAILISALANILADTVGAFTGSPDVTLLCVSNIASMFVDYIYQLTFYSAILCIAGKFEMKAEKAKKNVHNIEIDGDNSVTISHCCQTSFDFHDKVRRNCISFLDCYVNFISNKFKALGILLLWILFIGVSIVGVLRIRIWFNLENLFAHDSPLIEAEHLRLTYRTSQVIMDQFFVSNPGNLSDPERLRRLNQMVDELESIKGSWGPDGTTYFVRDFIEFEKASEDFDDGSEELQQKKVSNQLSLFDEHDIPDFLKWPENRMWQGFVHFDESGKKLKEFLFSTSYHGNYLKAWPQRAQLMNKVRSVVDKYREFNVSAFHDDGIVLDWIENMPTDAWQSTLGTVVCMGFIFFLFLNDFFTVCIVSVTVLSITIGVIGTASWMGFDLEPTMFVAIIISMGCSIDIPAHASFHYNVSATSVEHPTTVKEKLRICLGSVGLPAIQTSLSTNLCVLSLRLTPLYMGQVFATIMILCITFTVIHGLVIIPSLFVVIDVLTGLFGKCRKQKIFAETQS